MGFDGAPPNGRGSTAELARGLNLPVVLIVDAKAMSQSIAALVAGFVNHDPEVRIAGLILNRVGSARHGEMLKTALAPLGIPVLGMVPRSETLSRPSRHLGLVQAGEMPDLNRFLDAAADVMSGHIDLVKLTQIMQPPAVQPGVTGITARAPRRIALARDAAFSFVYPHHIADWVASGSTILPFSLYAATLAAAETFMQSLREAAQSIEIYGECGGYMTLGESLIDAEGTAHKMAGLLGLGTSFADRKLHLGYRRLTGLTHTHPDQYTAHEFHYATTVEAQGTPLFDAQDAQGTSLGAIGLVEGKVSGSFAHIIDVI